MYETAQKYSEHGYYAKEVIAQEIDSYLLEPIWQEVKTYRSFFRYDLKVNDKVVFLTRNPFVISKILQLEEQIKRYEREYQHTTTYDCAYLNDVQNEQYKQFVTHLKLHSSISLEEYFHTFCMQFAVRDVFKPHIEFLLNHEEPFLLRFFTLALMRSRRSMSLLLQPFLVSQRKEVMQELFSIIEFADTFTEEIVGDATYAFLEMLEQLRLILYKKMLLLNNTAKEQYKVLQEKELLECYPELKKEQVCFYVEHREIGHYYTIQNYIQQSQVCYETARYSLDELVNKHWYEKKKIGKKFVYFIV